MHQQKLFDYLCEHGYSPRDARRAVARYMETGDEELLWYDPEELA